MSGHEAAHSLQLLLFMRCQYRNRTFIHQLLGIACFENTVEEGMISWDGDQDVNVFIRNKGLRCFVKIISSNEIKFSVELIEHVQQPASLL